MTDEEKQALRNSMAGKKVSEMTAQERELFDQEFQYGLNDTPKIKRAALKSKPPSKPKDGLSKPHEFNRQKVMRSTSTAENNPPMRRRDVGVTYANCRQSG